MGVSRETKCDRRSKRRTAVFRVAFHVKHAPIRPCRSEKRPSCLRVSRETGRCPSSRRALTDPSADQPGVRTVGGAPVHATRVIRPRDGWACSERNAARAPVAVQGRRRPRFGRAGADDDAFVAGKVRCHWTRDTLYLPPSTRPPFHALCPFLGARRPGCPSATVEPDDVAARNDHDGTNPWRVFPAEAGVIRPRPRTRWARRDRWSQPHLPRLAPGRDPARAGSRTPHPAPSAQLPGRNSVDSHIGLLAVCAPLTSQELSGAMPSAAGPAAGRAFGFT